MNPAIRESLIAGEISAVIDNMRSLVKQWRNSLGEHGELVFYIDAC